MIGWHDKWLSLSNNTMNVSVNLVHNLITIIRQSPKVDDNNKHSLVELTLTNLISFAFIRSSTFCHQILICITCYNIINRMISNKYKTKISLSLSDSLPTNVTRMILLIMHIWVTTTTF